MKLLFSLFLLGITAVANSAAIYTYTGNPYATVTNSTDNPALGYGPYPNGSMANPEPYDSSMFVSANLTFAEQLSANFYYEIDLLDYSLSDGVNVLTAANSYIHAFELIGASDGGVQAWAIEARSLDYAFSTTEQIRIATYWAGPGMIVNAQYDEAYQFCGTASCANGQPLDPGTFFDGIAGNTGLPGSWTSEVVPVPAAAWLLGSALLSLGWVRRKSSA